MNDTKTMGLRLPVQAAVDRSATGAALADGTGVEASQSLQDILGGIAKVAGPILGGLFGF
jgi:hypothetical protein